MEVGKIKRDNVVGRLTRESKTEIKCRVPISDKSSVGGERGKLYNSA